VQVAGAVGCPWGELGANPSEWCVFLDDQVVERGAAGVLLLGNVRVSGPLFLHQVRVGGLLHAVHKDKERQNWSGGCAAPHLLTKSTHGMGQQAGSCHTKTKACCLLSPQQHFCLLQVTATAVPVYRPAGPRMLATAVNAGNVLELDGWPAGQQVGSRVHGAAGTQSWQCSCCILESAYTNPVRPVNVSTFRAA
jgi:hypothetical protein